MKLEIGDEMGITILEAPMFQDEEKEVPSYIGPELRSFCEYWQKEKDVDYKAVYADYEEDRYLILVKQDLSEEEYEWFRKLVSMSEDELKRISVKEDKLFSLERTHDTMDKYFDLKSLSIDQMKKDLMNFLEDTGLIQKAQVKSIERPDDTEILYKVPYYYVERLSPDGSVEEHYTTIDQPVKYIAGEYRRVDLEEKAKELADALYEQDGRHYVVERGWEEIEYDELPWQWHFEDMSRSQFKNIMERYGFERLDIEPKPRDYYEEEIVYDTHRRNE